MRAAPTQVEPNKGTRNLNCNNYSACVDQAARRCWENFTCASCPMRKQGAPLRADAFLGRTTSSMDFQ